MFSSNKLNPKNSLRIRNSTRSRVAIKSKFPTIFDDFSPNPGGQTEFLELAGWANSNPLEHRWTAAIGGINSGKSFAGAIWSVTRALLDPEARGMITANDYGQLSRASLVTLVEVCRLFDVPLEPYRESIEDQALAIANCQRCYIGSQKAFVYVISANNFTGKTQAGRGLQIRWVWADEYAYAPEQAFLTIDGRLGRGPGELKGQGIVTTSPAGYNYLYWKFGDPTRTETLQELYKMATLSSLENIHSGADYVESLKANYTDELYLQEIEGKFINTSIGLVYKYFSRSIHVLNGEDAKILDYERSLPLLLTFDFNHSPIVCLAAQKRGKEIHFFKEWSIMDSDIWELTDKIVDWVRSEGLPPEIQIFGDATGRARTAASRLSSWDIVFQGLNPLLSERGMGYLVKKFADINPNVINRVHSFNQCFQKKLIYVHPSCKNFIKDLEQVTWDDNNAINKKINPQLSHLSDAAGYLVHSLYPFKPELAISKKGKLSGIAG